MKTRVAFGVTGAVVVILALFVFPPIVAQLLTFVPLHCIARQAPEYPARARTNHQ